MKHKIKIKTLQIEDNYVIAVAFNKSYSGSIKDLFIRELMKNLHTTATTFIEASSGNTGIALAKCCKVIDEFNCLIVLPSTASKARIKMLSKLGADVVVVDGGMEEAQETAKELVAQIPNSYYVDQFNNPNNVNGYKMIGAFIKEQINPDYFITGIGTGGTIMGIKSQLSPFTEVWGVEPEESPIISKSEKGKHGIEGIGAGFYPPLMEKGFKNIIRVSTDEAIYHTKQLHKHGHKVGISSGANIAAIYKLIEQKKLHHKVICTIFVDNFNRYDKFRRK